MSDYEFKYNDKDTGDFVIVSFDSPVAFYSIIEYLKKFLLATGEYSDNVDRIIYRDRDEE